jgi:excisionase family DNA binding protein
MSDTPVTIAEIARLCGVKPRTVRRWIERGELRAVRVDRRRVRIRSYDLESTLAATWRARSAGTRLDPRSLVSRALLQEDGCWRWTMFALWPVLWVAAIALSVGLGH